MAAAAVALHLGAAFQDIAAALAKFQNTRRRFEYYGERGGVRVYHDYAHHPAEIRATLEGAYRMPHKKLWCVFQCNSYTRAKTLFTGTVTCFNQADEVLVPDIYPGREVDDGTVHAKDMVAAINASGGNATYLGTFESFRDLTRIARIDETLWSELFLHNRDALLQQIDRFSAALAQLREQVAAENEAGLKAMFRLSSQRRSWLNQPQQPGSR